MVPINLNQTDRLELFKREPRAGAHLLHLRGEGGREEQRLALALLRQVAAGHDLVQVPGGDACWRPAVRVACHGVLLTKI